jgi:hypothetical protein
MGFIFSAFLLLGSLLPLWAQEEGEVLFEDDFEDSKVLPGWEWDEDDRDLARVATDGDNRVLRMVGDDGDSSFMFVEDSADWENYALELRFKVLETSDDFYDLVMVVNEDVENSASTGAVISYENEEVSVVAIFDDNDDTVGREDFEFEVDEWYSVRFAVQGERIEFSINGELLIEEETDEQSDHGSVGIICGGESVILIDDVRVVALADEENLINEIDVGSLIGNNNNDTDDDAADEPEEVATVEVTVNSANLRAGPGTDFAIVGTAQRGDTFDVIAQTGEGDDIWYLIVGNDPDVETWIFSGTVQLEPEDAEVPDVEDVQP